MALKKGSEDQTKNETPPSFEQLVETIQRMEREMAEMKASGQPVAVAAPGMISIDMVKQLMKEMRPEEKRQADVIDYTKAYLQNVDIDKDDFNEVGVTFCAYSTMYVVVDDKRNGANVLPPYGNRIVFDYQATSKYKVGKYDEISTYCAHTSHSNKEIKWLREHTFFGSRFYEGAKEALSVSGEKAEVITRCMNRVNNMNQSDIVKYCKDPKYGVPITDDLRSMRVDLANKLADEEYGIKKQNRGIVERNTREDHLLENR